jgi:hypothetical protein
MTWRRGLLRLWLVGSIGWIGFVSWVGYQRLSQLSCFDTRKANPSLGNPYLCLPDAGFPQFDKLFPIQFAQTPWQFVAWALVPIGLGFMAGIVLTWIIAGFRAPTS